MLIEFFVHFKVGFLELAEGIVGGDLKLADVGRRGVKHGIHHDGLDYGAQASCDKLVLDGLVDDEVEGLGRECQVDAVHLKQFLILADDGVLGFGEHPAEGVAVKRLEMGEHRQTAYDFGDEAERLEVLRSHIPEEIVAVNSFAGRVAVANHMGVEALGNLALDAVESTAADEEDVFGIDRNHLLLGMLAAALRGNVDNRAFEELEEALLYAFARHVAGYRGVVALAGYLVDFIYEHNASLGLGHIVVGGLEEACEKAFDILAHIAGLGEHRGVDNGERNVEQPGYSLCQQGLAGAGWTYEDDVGLFDVDIIVVLCQTFVVVVDGHREVTFGGILTYDVAVKEFAYLLGLGHFVKVRLLGLVLTEAFGGHVFGHELLDLAHAVGADKSVAYGAWHQQSVGRSGYAAEGAHHRGVITAC